MNIISQLHCLIQPISTYFIGMECYKYTYSPDIHTIGMDNETVESNINNRHIIQSKQIFLEI